jgi:hypothetical protein
VDPRSRDDISVLKIMGTDGMSDVSDVDMEEGAAIARVDDSDEDEVPEKTPHSKGASQKAALIQIMMDSGQKRVLETFVPRLNALGPAKNLKQWRKVKDSISNVWLDITLNLHCSVGQRCAFRPNREDLKSARC